MRSKNNISPTSKIYFVCLVHIAQQRGTNKNEYITHKRVLNYPGYNGFFAQLLSQIIF